MRDGETAPNPHAQSVRKLASAMVRTAVLPALAAVVLCAVVATVFIGTTGLSGALVGGAVGFGSSLLTILLMRLSADLPVMMVMAIALGGYVFKLLALLVVMVLLKGVDAFHRPALALSMLAVVMVWAGAEIVAFKRTKIPTLIV